MRLKDSLTTRSNELVPGNQGSHHLLASKRQTLNSEQNPDGLVSDSFVTNDQLKEEIQNIDDRLKNLRESEFDERSDNAFSNMQSQVQGVNTSDRSGQPHQFTGYQIGSNDKNVRQLEEPIQEDENEDYDKSYNANELLKAGNGAVSASEVPKNPHKLSVKQPAPAANTLIKRIDQQIGERQSAATAADPHSSLEQEGSVRMVEFVEL